MKDATPRLPEQSFILNPTPSENTTAQIFRAAQVSFYIAR